MTKRERIYHSRKKLLKWYYELGMLHIRNAPEAAISQAIREFKNSGVRLGKVPPETRIPVGKTGFYNLGLHIHKPNP